MEDFEV